MGKGGPCWNCGTMSTPLWRPGPPEKPVLCNACGLRYKTRGTMIDYVPRHALDCESHRSKRQLPIISQIPSKMRSTESLPPHSSVVTELRRDFHEIINTEEFKNSWANHEENSLVFNSEYKYDAEFPTGCVLLVNPSAISNHGELASNKVSTLDDKKTNKEEHQP